MGRHLRLVRTVPARVRCGQVIEAVLLAHVGVRYGEHTVVGLPGDTVDIQCPGEGPGDEQWVCRVCGTRNLATGEVEQ